MEVDTEFSVLQGTEVGSGSVVGGENGHGRANVVELRVGLIRVIRVQERCGVVGSKRVESGREVVQSLDLVSVD